MNVRRVWVLALGVFLLLGLVLGITSVQARGRHPHPPRNSKGGLSAPLTAAKVTAYVTTHPSSLGPTVNGGYPSLVSIQEITALQLSTLLHEAPPSSNPNKLVFYVVLHGPFVLEYVPLPPGTQPPTVSNVFEVFDVNTTYVIEDGVA
jgi:hypothetical protein